MRKVVLVFLLISFLWPGALFGLSWQSAERILNSAKLDTFDEEWDEALIG